MHSAFTTSCLLLALLGTSIITAQEKDNYLSARESDPNNYGWMQGSPPPDDRLLHAWVGSFFEFPAIRWSVVHLRKMLPTVIVVRGLDAPRPLEYELDITKIDEFTFLPWNADEPMRWVGSSPEFRVCQWPNFWPTRSGAKPVWNKPLTTRSTARRPSLSLITQV